MHVHYTVIKKVKVSSKSASVGRNNEKKIMKKMTNVVAADTLKQTWEVRNIKVKDDFISTQKQIHIHYKTTTCPKDIYLLYK